MAELDEFVVTAPAPRTEAFAPPVPVDLVPFQLQPQFRTAGPPGSALGAWLLNQATSLAGGLLLLAFPQPLGPREFDEAPTPPQKPPTPPASADPLEPPNWDDLSQGGDERLLDPLVPTGMPFPVPPKPEPLPEFVVSPPSPELRPVSDLPNPFDDPFFWMNPYGRPGTVTRTAPGPGPGPGPTPFSTPGIDPFPGLPQPDAAPRPAVRPVPSDRPAPEPYSPALPDPFGRPSGAPEPAPTLPDAVGPRPVAPTDPRFFADPLNPFAEPFAQPSSPRPPKEADTCQCEKPKKKPQKRKERDLCYRGTYVQHTKGISYKRLEQVPCEPAPKKPTTRKRSPKLKPGQFPGSQLWGSENLTPADLVDLGTEAFRQFYPIVDDWLSERRKKKSPPEEKPGKKSKPKKPRKKPNRKPKTTVPRIPGTIYTSPF